MLDGYEGYIQKLTHWNNCITTPSKNTLQIAIIVKKMYKGITGSDKIDITALKDVCLIYKPG